MRTWLNFLSVMSLVAPLAVSAGCTAKIGFESADVKDLGSGGNGGAAGSPGVAGAGASPPMTTCDASPDEDRDHDGFTIDQGDCNDCNPAVNPNAVEVIAAGNGGAATDPVDDDCDGTIDNVPEGCDGDVAVDDPDPLSAAKAVELCKRSTGPNDWGVVSARWVKVDGSPPPEEAEANQNFHLGHGVLTEFGANVKPRSGAKLLALSSGAARQPTDPGYVSPSGFDKHYAGAFPQGFPKTSPTCSEVTPATPVDPTAVEITVRAPSNAHGFSFNVDFYTYDWPDSVCNEYNDFFIALVAPIPPGRVDGHLLFDDVGNPMSVNSAFIDVCGCADGPPCNARGREFACSLGANDLLGTGFESRAATGWLVTTVPVEPNQEITIRWGAYDSGDSQLDSTGLIDNWRWITEPGTQVLTRPGTD